MPATYSYRYAGKLTEVTSNLLIAEISLAKLGDWVEVQPKSSRAVKAQIVRIVGEHCYLTPIATTHGLATGDAVCYWGKNLSVNFTPNLATKTVNGLLSETNSSDPSTSKLTLENNFFPPKKKLTKKILTGIASIDLFLPLALGQKIGIFANAGVGKTTLLQTLAQAPIFDYVIYLLVGERQSEIVLLTEQLSNRHFQNYTVIAEPNSAHPLMKRIAPYSAISLAERLLQDNQNILIVFDSLTRWCRTVRDLAISAGEPLIQAGITGSLLRELPKIMDCCGQYSQGSITTLYSVLLNTQSADPLEEEVVSLIDSHLYLDAFLPTPVEQPKINLTISCSRQLGQLHSPEFLKKVLLVSNNLKIAQKEAQYYELLGSSQQKSQARIIHDNFYQLAANLARENYCYSALEEILDLLLAQATTKTN